MDWLERKGIDETVLPPENGDRILRLSFTVDVLENKDNIILGTIRPKNGETPLEVNIKLNLPS